MKAVVFDVWSDYAHFRKPFSTTSSLSFILPPVTAIAGLVGAIMGIESGGFGRSKHIPYLREHNGQFAVRLLKPANKTRVSLNYLKTKDDGKGRSIQVPIELIREPAYRIYVTLEEGLLSKLVDKLQRQETHYTPCLGLSELIAAFRFVDLLELSPVELPAQVDTVVPLDFFEIEIEAGKEYLKETHSTDMDQNRQVTSFLTMAYERTRKSIKVMGTKNANHAVWGGKIEDRWENMIFV